MRFYLNIDHVATVRQARRTDEPDPVRAAVLAELAGVDGITVHLREDRRHIQDRDLRLLMQIVRTGVNLELAIASDILELAHELRPMQVTLVPENREEVTTEGGLDLSRDSKRAEIGEAIRSLGESGIRTVLFVDPDEESIRCSAELGSDAVELHTGEYANSWRAKPEKEQIERLGRAATLARDLALAVHAGHGLTYENVSQVVQIREIEELNIGHSVIARAVLVGMENAVREMSEILRRARSRA
ncbi:MAG: pyridoxine 5'-phosphate synthase [Gemmatimonadota bacterium]|nr:pyridoxine 5'-phosphate synthase [Gemmatimonadota bacterium]MEC9317917.1 pyridoxine 5'-phosphate synthase [Gemmatimonadota bacterium]